MSGLDKDDILRMAREAGGDDWGIFREFMPEIERFAALVAAAEREACAQAAEAVVPRHTECGNKIAAVIRARGNDAA